MKNLRNIFLVSQILREKSQNFAEKINEKINEKLDGKSGKFGKLSKKMNLNFRNECENGASFSRDKNLENFAKKSQKSRIEILNIRRIFSENSRGFQNDRISRIKNFAIARRMKFAGGIFGIFAFFAISAGIFGFFAGNSQNFARAADSGKANLTSVEIIQKGTDASANLAENEVLTNDSVKYQAVYAVSAAGQITLTATFPANTTVDSSSVSNSAGCENGSALSSSADSKTRNIATCIINATATGSINWSFSAKLWGANGAKVAPILKISGAESDVKAPELILSAENPNYELNIGIGTDTMPRDGYNTSARISWNLYAPLTETGGVSGVEALENGEYSFAVDTSSFPDGWIVRECGLSENRAGYPGGGPSPDGSKNSVVFLGDEITCEKSADGAELTISVKNIATGVANYPTLGDLGNAITDRAIYSLGHFVIGVPVSALTADNQTFSLVAKDFSATGLSGVKNKDALANKPTWNFTMNNLSRGNSLGFIYGLNDGAASYSTYHYMPAGQKFTWGLGTQTNVAPLESDNTADNFYDCATFDPSKVAIDENPTWFATVTGERIIEYGVVGTDMNISPDPLEGGAACGEAGDGAENFFANLTDAQNYAAEKGLKVNAVRLFAEHFSVGRDQRAIYLPMQMTPNSETSTILPVGTQIKLLERTKTDQWIGGTSYDMQILTIIGGRTRPKLAVSNSTETSPNIAVGGTETITFTPNTDGIDTNLTTTFTLPQGLKYVAGSAKQNNNALLPQITENTDGTTTLVFNFEKMGENVTEYNKDQPPLTFDVLVDTAVIMPQTMQISATVQSDGDSKAMPLATRTATANFSVAAQASFGYNLSESAQIIEVGDSLTYNFANYNTTSAAVNNLREIVVLPFDGDARGTSGLANYSVAEISADENYKIYYTLDEKIRENSAENVSWILYDGGTLPAKITAVKFESATLNAGETKSAKIVLNNFDAETGAKINLDISRISTDEFGLAQNQNQVFAEYQVSEISGFVYRDKNISGDFSNEDLALSNVKINLLTDGKVAKSTTTDANGKYIFENLTSGNYEIEIAENQANIANLVSNLDFPQKIALALGANLTDENFGFVAKIVAKDDFAQQTVAANLAENPPISLDILKNDVGANGENNLNLTVLRAGFADENSQNSAGNSENCAAPKLGKVEILAGKISYVANVGANGTDEFCYEIGDEFGQKTVAKVKITLKLPQFVVNFATFGGSEISAQTVIDREFASEPEKTPSRAGYQFLGWFADENFENEFDFSATKIVKNTTVFASWQKMCEYNFAILPDDENCREKCPWNFEIFADDENCKKPQISAPISEENSVEIIAPNTGIRAEILADEIQLFAQKIQTIFAF